MSKLPTILQETGQQSAQAFVQRHGETPLFASHRCELTELFALSDFASDTLQRYPQMMEVLLEQGLLSTRNCDYRERLNTELSSVESEVALHATLRQFRHLHMVRLAWLDLTQRQTIESSLVQMSALADALIMGAYRWLYADFCRRYGTPQGEFGPQPMFILGMGKLGGQELNFSSDIDLIFAYPSAGSTSGARKSLEHQQFFTRLAQKLIAALHQSTLDGQVFRVDMRLRPFGESGPLVSHFNALEDYYQEQGREWERFAMIKARILNEASPYTEPLTQILTPFTYRRYLDFGAIDSLRKMKQLIRQEVHRRKLTDNIKLGAGGIREVEFIVQSFQLIRGGREPMLRCASILHNFTLLSQLNAFTTEEVETLRKSYLFLRKVEHCLQQFDDRQTQTLPDNEKDRTRLCYVMNLPHYSDLLDKVNQHMTQIHQHFISLIGESGEHDSVPHLNKDFQDLWNLNLHDEEAHSILQGYVPDVESTTIWKQLYQFKENVSKRGIGQKGQDVMQVLMPAVLEKCLSDRSQSRTQVLERVFVVLNAIAGRTTYLQLLNENPGALGQLLKLCASSPWIAAQLARFPILLDELLNPTQLYNPIELASYPDELRQFMLRVEPDDLEGQMELLRQCKLSLQLKTAAADVTGALPVMKVSDHLTFLAEAMVNQVVEYAWQQMTSKYGAPEGKSAQNKGFAVIGYGKLGGLELGYGSDLDLVFLHNAKTNTHTNGDKPIESGVFYARLAQRILHLFSTKMGSGVLYEIDMRLRPSGNAGLLVCHVDGFDHYQQQEAWTWEHQALVRARFVYGEDEMRQVFNEIRKKVLAQPRDTQILAEDVQSMREKMRAHLDQGNDQTFDLKQGIGGIADIEFMVQYWVLANAAHCPDLVKWSDNIRILQDLRSQGVIEQATQETLSDAYLTLRNSLHRLTLQDQKSVDLTERFQRSRQRISAIWTQVFGSQKMS